MDSNQLEDANEAFYPGRASRPTALTRLYDYASQTSEAAADAQVLASKTKHALIEQRAEADMAATATTEMTASINEVAANIQQTAQEAEGAAALVMHSSSVATNTLQVIRVLSETVEEITTAPSNWPPKPSRSTWRPT